MLVDGCLHAGIEAIFRSGKRGGSEDGNCVWGIAPGDHAGGRDRCAGGEFKDEVEGAEDCAGTLHR